MANATTFTGIGELSLSTTDTPFTSSQDVSFFPITGSVSLTKTVNITKQFGFVPCGGTGTRTQVGFFRDQAEFSGELTIPTPTWLDMQLLFGQLASSETITHHVNQCAVIASDIITDASLNGLTPAQVHVTNPYYDGTGGTERFLEVVASPAVPTADQVELDNSANTLTFDSTLNGLTAYYTVETATTRTSVGADLTPTLIQGLQLDMVIQTTSGSNAANGWRVFVPNLELDGNWTLSATGADEITVPFQPLQTASANSPVIIFPAG